MLRSARLLLLLPLGTLLCPAVAHAGGALMIRSGAMQLVDTSQMLDGSARDLDTWSHSVFSVSVEGRTRHDIALGAEYISYRNNFSPPAGNTGEARAKIALFVVKKYFLEGGVVHPFIGAGLGAGNTEYSYTTGGTTYSDHSFTAAVQLNAGAEFRFGNLALAIEVKHLAHDVDKDWNDYNASATGLFAGIGFIW